MRTFFISDTHFGHFNIIRYEDRPFQTTEEMDREIIKRWNETVGKKDTVWMLGDFCLSNRARIREIVKQLNGNKNLIIGNHDRYTPSFYEECGFQYVSKYPVILKQHFILSHAPLDQMNKNNDFFYIYGHIHGDPNFETSTENSRCVCCERQSYRPIQIEEFNKF